jgi:hypothetical protein
MPKIQKIITEVTIRDPRPPPAATELMDIVIWQDGDQSHAETGEALCDHPFRASRSSTSGWGLPPKVFGRGYDVPSATRTSRPTLRM